jgi:uncharacterized protein (TIGR01244 family)
MTSILASLLTLLGAFTMQDDTASIVTRHHDVWIASQPSEADLDAWAAAGAGTVVNSRTPEETAGLPFDLRVAVESRGMQYVEMPIGGRSGADPAHTVALAALLDGAEGPVVMHCRSGTRSAHLYAAHLQSSQMSADTAFTVMGWPGGRDQSLVQALTPQ